MIMLVMIMMGSLSKSYRSSALELLKWLLQECAPGSSDTLTGCPREASKAHKSSSGSPVIRHSSRAQPGSMGWSLGCQPRSSGMRNEALFLQGHMNGDSDIQPELMGVARLI